jgi:hypothetical protein
MTSPLGSALVEAAGATSHFANRHDKKSVLPKVFNHVITIRNEGSRSVG